MRILITGSTGFLGRHVLAAARRIPDARLRLAVRTPPPAGGHTVPGPADPGSAVPGPVEYVPADLADPATLDGLCRDVDVLLHCASLVGGDEAAMAAVNDRGTAALVDDARRHRVRRIGYLSTAAVHGRGPFRGERTTELPLDPASPTSRTRAAAERHVLAAGGTVLRPNLVYGTGDRWFAPGLARLHRRLTADPDGWSARLTVVEAGDLAELALAAALAPEPLPGAYLVGEPEPVLCATVVAALAEHAGLVPHRAATDLATARAALAGDPGAEVALHLTTTDRWFAVDDLRRRLGLPPAPGLTARFPAHAPWYTAALAADAAPTPASQGAR
ncbi:hypothetical protein GCM10010441_27830 [Kitasatospora paracochleata]|uniref:Nucleoside-diphosphate-sugar epimerase n=1 Tax=Kitasatospora paracochleata TaxID=58354 RepID=A0ABT1IZ79_9ACTN|nr:NAD-dependent epimerase/dehydratase family protein [Kitasatospora paracochleata]MCP2310213.1 nucleoside-diphosphate-sugar epimerase [Kitasatospora paracochleata]